MTECVTVGEIATLTDGPFGSNLKTSHYVDSGPRVVRLQNLGDGVFRDEHAHIATDHFERLRKHEVLAGDIVAASLGEDAPRACLIPAWLGPAIVKADCIRIRVADGMESAYVMWMLNSPPVREQGAARIKGVGRPRLGLGGIRALEIPVPPLNEQRRIVAAIEEHLSRLDVADASLAAALMRLVGLRRVSSAGMAETGELVPLGDVAVVSSGQTPKGLETSASGPIPYYKVGDMNAADGLRMGAARSYVTEAEALRARLRIFPVGTVVFPKRGGAIATNKKRITTAPAALDLNTMAVIAGDRLLAEFLLAYLETVDLASLADGSNVPQINHGDIAPLEIPLPPLEAQRRIVQEVEERLSRIDALRLSIERAQRRSATLRAAILERAFRGELVPQDPADEPAEALLARIRAERDTSIAPTGRRRKTVRP
jgi:restriction endonuclease S subunit